LGMMMNLIVKDMKDTQAMQVRWMFARLCKAVLCGMHCYLQCVGVMMSVTAKTMRGTRALQVAKAHCVAYIFNTAAASLETLPSLLHSCWLHSSLGVGLHMCSCTAPCVLLHIVQQALRSSLCTACLPSLAVHHLH
jgi:hypothetical protein